MRRSPRHSTTPGADDIGTPPQREAWGRRELAILPRQGWRSLALAVALGLVFGAWMALADAFLFRAAVPAGQTALVAATGTLERIAAFAPRAVLDEILFRLLLVSALVWVFTRLPGQWRYWLAIVAAAILYVPLHPAWLADPGPLLLAREAALHVAAGVLWGWLYWRHGLLAAIVGHVAAHLSLQPLLGAAFG